MAPIPAPRFATVPAPRHRSESAVRALWTAWLATLAVPMRSVVTSSEVRLRHRQRLLAAARQWEAERHAAVRAGPPADQLDDPRDRYQRCLGRALTTESPPGSRTAIWPMRCGTARQRLRHIGCQNCWCRSSSG
jgi:hypothetical protein